MTDKPDPGASRRGGADPGHRICIATSRPNRPRARRSPRSAACATFSPRVRRSTCTPMQRRPLPCRRAGRARIGQTCVVTLDPIESDIDEPIDLIFAPPEQIPEMADLVDEAVESDVEIPDPPEPIENGVIDLGRLATDALFLAVDPYPRKPDAVFEPPVVADDPEDHPFAALKALQLGRNRRAEEARRHERAKARLNSHQARIPVEADPSLQQEFA